MSFAANSPSPSRALVAKRRQGSSRWLVAGLLVFAAMPLTFGVLRLLQLAGISDAMPPVHVLPVPLILHIVGALLFAILGAFQFSASIRRRWPSWHRAAGRVALTGALLVALSALWLTVLYVTPSTGGLLLAGLRIVVALGMLISLGLGVSAVLRRDMTNDGFSGISGVNGWELDGPLTLEVRGYDAGSEINNEKTGYLGALGGGNERDPENGVIAYHAGIRGDADAPAEWKFDPHAPVARVTLTPLDQAAM